MSQLQTDIALLKVSMQRARAALTITLYDQPLFTLGTREAILAARTAELNRMFRKLDKVKKSIPKKLLKKIDAYCASMSFASLMNDTIYAYADEDPWFDNAVICDTVRDDFIQAKQESVKAYHDLAKHLLLQETLSEHIPAIETTTSQTAHLHAFTKDVFDAPKRDAVLTDIHDMESTQRCERRKKIAGISMRIIGWGIIITASVITFNPAIGLTLLGLSIIVTGFGELLNRVGKRLAKKPIAQLQISAVRDSLLFFKSTPPKAAENNKSQPDYDETVTRSLTQESNDRRPSFSRSA